MSASVPKPCRKVTDRPLDRPQDGQWRQMYLVTLFRPCVLAILTIRARKNTPITFR